MAHSHYVTDSDRHFTIDPVTREIINESGKFTLIQHDHNSERFTFDIPKLVDGHDMSQCNVVQVHYINIEGETQTEYADVYECDDLQVCPDDPEKVCCSWLISRNATQFVGNLSFVVHFKCVTDGEIDYAWSTAIYSKVAVCDGIQNSEAAVSQYTDVIEQWRQALILANVVTEYTPAEARAALEVTTTVRETATLSKNGWSGNQQTVSASIATADNTVFVSPAPDETSFRTYNENGVRCVSQGAGTLTFQCENEPDADIAINIVILA